MIQAALSILTQFTGKIQRSCFMSKSIAFACRVVVMLTFLIAIPLIALFGKSLPDVAGTVWEYWQKPKAEENAWADAGEAPLYSPETAAKVSPHGPSGMPLATNGLSSVNPATFIAPAEQPGRASNPSVSPSRQSLSHLPYLRPNMASNTTSPNAGGTMPNANGTMPINTHVAPPYGNQPLAPQRITPSPSSTNRPLPLPSTLPPAQQQTIEGIFARLKQLGAMHYQLEYWGNQPRLYRFECRMAVVGTQGLTQQFEATDPDQVKAAITVLRKVEAWRAAFPPAAVPVAPISNGMNAPR